MQFLSFLILTTFFVVFTIASTDISLGRKLLGGEGVSLEDVLASNFQTGSLQDLLNSNFQNSAPPRVPPPSHPPLLSVRESLVKLAWKYLVDVFQSRIAETNEIEMTKIEDKHEQFENTTMNSEFAKKLVAKANALSTENGLAGLDYGSNFLNVDSSVKDKLCTSSELVRHFNETAFDDAYIQAWPLKANKEVPVGFYRGCILGSDFRTTLAKIYGIRRTLTYNAWRGKCFGKITTKSTEQ